MITVDYTDDGVLVTFEAFGQTATATASTPSNAAYAVAKKFLENLLDKYLGPVQFILYRNEKRSEELIAKLNAAAADGFTVKIEDNIEKWGIHIFKIGEQPKGFVEYDRNEEIGIVRGVVLPGHCADHRWIAYDSKFREKIRARRMYVDSIGIEKKSATGDILYLRHSFSLANDTYSSTKLTVYIAEDHIDMLDCNYNKSVDYLAWQICASLLNRQPKLI